MNMIYCGTRIKLKEGCVIKVSGADNIDQNTDAFVWVQDVSEDEKIVSVECMVSPQKNISLTLPGESFHHYFDEYPADIEMCFADWTNPIILKHPDESISVQLSYKFIPAVDLTILTKGEIKASKLTDGNQYDTLLDSLTFFIEEAGLVADIKLIEKALCEYMITSIFHCSNSFVDFYKYFYSKSSS